MVKHWMRYPGVRGGGSSPNCLYRSSVHNKKNGANHIYDFVKMMGKKDLKPIKKGSIGSQIKEKMMAK